MITHSEHNYMRKHSAPQLSHQKVPLSPRGRWQTVSRAIQQGFRLRIQTERILYVVGGVDFNSLSVTTGVSVDKVPQSLSNVYFISLSFTIIYFFLYQSVLFLWYFLMKGVKRGPENVLRKHLFNKSTPFNRLQN